MTESAIDWGGGYSCSLRLMEVDRDTWADADAVEGFASASVERDRSNDLMESASVSVHAESPIKGERWLRIEMLADSGTAVERHAIGTFLFSPGNSKASAGAYEVELSGRSVLAPAEDVVLLAGTYAPRGADGAAYAARLLRECTPAPVTVDGEFTLADHVVFARGTTHLEAAWMLLRTANWCIQVDGEGRVYVRKVPTDPDMVLDRANARLLGTEVDLEGAMEDVPNRYIAVDDEQVAIEVDESDAQTSYTSRGRYVDYYDDSPQRIDGESLRAYAKRRLAEETEVVGKRSYGREWWPGVMPYSLVKGSIASVGLDCDLRVLSQSLTIGNGVSVTEVSEVIR